MFWASNIIITIDAHIKYRPAPIPKLATFYTIFVFKLTLCPFSSLVSDSKIHKGFKSQIIQEGTFIFASWDGDVLSSVSFSHLAAVCSENAHRISISSSFTSFLSHVTSLQFSLYNRQKCYMKYKAKVSKKITLAKSLGCVGWGWVEAH